MNANVDPRVLPPAFVTVVDAAAILALPKRRIYDYVADGTLPASQVGNRLIIPTPAVYAVAADLTAGMAHGPAREAAEDAAGALRGWSDAVRGRLAPRGATASEVAA